LFLVGLWDADSLDKKSGKTEKRTKKKKEKKNKKNQKRKPSRAYRTPESSFLESNHRFRPIASGSLPFPCPWLEHGKKKMRKKEK